MKVRDERIDTQSTGEALEQKLAERPQPEPLDWLQVVGISEDNEFTRQVVAEIEAQREEARREAQAEARRDPAGYGPRHRVADAAQ